MRILQVTPAYPPNAYGGVSTHVGLISKGLAALGHTVFVVTTNRFDTTHVMASSGLRYVDGIQVYYARAFWPARYFFAPSIPAILWRWAQTADIVHIHDTRTFASLAAYYVARTLGVPFVVTCHGSLSPWVGDTLLKELHDAVIGQGLVRKASRIIAVTEREKADIINQGIEDERVTVIPDSIPLTTSDITPEHLAIEAPQTKTVLYLGRLHPIKGVDRLVSAFASVAKARSDCELVIAGPDFGAESGLRRQVASLGIYDRVKFVGKKIGQSKQQLLKAASVVVVPSRYEVFGFVILEAMAAGVPVILSRDCGVSQELDRLGAALVTDSPPDMAEAIERCLTDSSMRDKLVRAGRDLIATRYNWDGVMKNLVRVYAESANRSPANLIP